MLLELHKYHSNHSPRLKRKIRKGKEQPNIERRAWAMTLE